MDVNHLNKIRRHSILFIEDQPYHTQKKALIRAGFDVDEAITAWRAFFLLKTRVYSGVILDLAIGVKEKDPELLREIRKNELFEEITQKILYPKGLPNWVPGVRILELILNETFAEVGNRGDLPVVVVSGVALADVHERVRKLLGGLAEERYLLKPVSFEKVVATLEKALGIS